MFSYKSPPQAKIFRNLIPESSKSLRKMHFRTYKVTKKPQKFSPAAGHFPRSDSFVYKNVSNLSQKFPPATNCFCNLFGSEFKHYVSPSGRVLNTLLKLEFPHIVFDKIHMLLKFKMPK